MPFPALFGISVAFGLFVWGGVARLYIWPALRELPSPQSLKPILLLHGFRFLGLAFVVPGVVSPDLLPHLPNPRLTAISSPPFWPCSLWLHWEPAAGSR